MFVLVDSIVSCCFTEEWASLRGPAVPKVLRFTVYVSTNLMGASILYADPKNDEKKLVDFGSKLTVLSVFCNFWPLLTSRLNAECSIYLG